MLIGGFYIRTEKKEGRQRREWKREVGSKKSK